MIQMRAMIESVSEIWAREVNDSNAYVCDLVIHSFLLATTDSPCLLSSTFVTLPTVPSSTDRQERQLPYINSEDRVRSPSGGASVCLLVISVYRKADTALRLACYFFCERCQGLHRASGRMPWHMRLKVFSVGNSKKKLVDDRQDDR